MPASAASACTAAMGETGCDSRHRAGEGNLIPRFGASDFGDQLERNGVRARRGAKQSRAAGTAHDAQGLGQLGRDQGHVALEQGRGDFVGRQRFDFEINLEPCFRVGDVPRVRDGTEEQIRIRRARRRWRRRQQARRAGTTRDDLQSVQHGDAIRSGRDLDDHRQARRHHHIAEHDVLRTFRPCQGRLPTGSAEGRERAERVRAGAEREDGVLFARHVGIGVAIQVEMVTARFEPAEGGDEVRAILRKDERVEHGVARGVPPDARRVRHGETDMAVAAIREF